MKDIMTVPEVAKFLLLDVSTIYKYLKNGEMDYFKVWVRYRIPKEEVLKFVENSNKEMVNNG